MELLGEHMQQTGIHVEISCNTESATSKLCRSKFEGLIVDFEPPEGIRLLRKMRELTSHKNAISLAIANHESDMPGAMRTDANFVLNHPLSSSAVARVLRASYPLMFRERQRYHRYPIEVRTLIRAGTVPEFSGQSINISESGIAIHSSSPLKTSARFFCGWICRAWSDRWNFPEKSNGPTNWDVLEFGLPILPRNYRSACGFGSQSK